MSLLITTIPKDPNEWATWLEGHLFGRQLQNLIAEMLQTLPLGEHPTLAELISANQLKQVRELGLQVLDGGEILSLMGSPRALLELEEVILGEGSSYWDSHLFESSDGTLQTRARTVARDTIKQYWTHGNQNAPTPQPKRTISAVYYLAGLAAMLLISFVYLPARPGFTGILGNPKLIGHNATSPSDFFKDMAMSCDAWFVHSEHVKSEGELLPLLAKLSKNFDALIESNPLQQAEKAWFTAKCRAWQSKVDGVILDLRSKKTSVKDGRDRANLIVEKMKNALLDSPAKSDLNPKHEKNA